ncbi:unnamed protein product [Linum tenue]|uniref:Uncharacterized protein n=1 Tax=Linum tenue TaxID=586396 RepID=A0AAV0MGC9_9ROSI|nr:unnamed protein product [Linum tenue]CAI0445337.1 unnamed protein product [Linum tenue]
MPKTHSSPSLLCSPEKKSPTLDSDTAIFFSSVPEFIGARIEFIKGSA